MADMIRSNNHSRLRWLSLLGLFLAGFLVLCPFSTTVVPAWQIQIVDTHGTPLRGASVFQSWRHYSLETNGHEEIKYADESG